jgi:uncharacterized integral membrane protein
VKNVWVVKGLVFLLLLFALVYFFLGNSSETVDIKLFGRSYLDISLFWVCVISFLLGFLVCFLWASFRWLKLHGQIRQLRGEMQTRQQEIVDLRTLPLEDMSSAEATEESDRG